MTGTTRLSQALDSHPDVLELIVSLNPHDFQRLRHPAMRRLMSPRISLRRVAQMAGINEADLLARIHRLIGEDIARDAPEESPPLPASPIEKPDWLLNVRDEDIPWVDTLPMDDSHADPLPPLIARWKQMQPGDVIGILHRWEPLPLYDVWSKIGLEFWSHCVAPDLWRIYLHKPSVGQGPHGK
jgi:hypothetical protein